MRNYFAIAFTCVYLILTVGVAKTTHYCMGRLSHAAIYSFEARKCPCFDPHRERGSCCKDEHQLIILDDDQNQGTVISANAPQFFEIGPLYAGSLPDISTFLKETSEESFTDSSPPPRKALFKFHCSFVFYG